MTESPSPPQTPRRPRTRWLSIGVAALVVAAGIALAALLGGRGPELEEFYLEPAAPQARRDLAESARRQRDDLLAGGFVPNSPDQGCREDVLQIAAAVQDYMLETGRLPHQLRDLGIGPDDVAAGVRIVSGRSHWRVYGPGGNLLARGN